jgi:hypothetical protein
MWNLTTDKKIYKETKLRPRKGIIVQHVCAHTHTHSQQTITCNTINHNTYDSLTYTGQTVRCCTADFTSHEHSHTKWGFAPEKQFNTTKILIVSQKINGSKPFTVIPDSCWLKPSASFPKWQPPLVIQLNTLHIKTPILGQTEKHTNSKGW